MGLDMDIQVLLLEVVEAGVDTVVMVVINSNTLLERHTDV
jgi:hypothetical protein